MNNQIKIESKERERGVLRINGERQTLYSPVGRGGYVSEKVVYSEGRGRGSTRGGSQFNISNQSRPLEQRTMRDSNENIDPRNLTRMIKQCQTLEVLNSLYDGQKGKEYFNCIHVASCFSQIVSLFTKDEGYKKIPKTQLMIYINQVFLNSEKFIARTLANISNDATKLLQYARKTKFEGAGNAEKLACDILCCILKEVTQRNDSESFTPQALSNIANNAAKLFEYAQKTEFEGAKEIKTLACSTLREIFQKVSQRKNLEDFNSQDLANTAHALVQAGYWDNGTSELLIKIGTCICNRNFNTFQLQNVCNLAWSFSIGKKISLIADWLMEGLSKLNPQNLSDLSPQSAKQLYTTFLRKALSENNWKKDDPDGFLKIYLNNIASKILQEMQKSDCTISKLQKDVGFALKENLPPGYSLEEEFDIKPYSIDFVLYRGNGNNAQLIAIIEVNGPTHFMLNGDYDLSYEFKENLLKDMGYSDIINIDYCKWHKSENKLNLIREKISAIIELKNEDKTFLNDSNVKMKNIIQKSISYTHVKK